MNNDPTLVPAELKAYGVPLWRIQTIRILQLLGLLAAFVGGADFLQVLALVPPDVASWLVVAGPTFAAGAKPLLMLIGDYLDDGVKNDSFKISTVIIPLLIPLTVLGYILTLSGCAGVSVQSPYGEFSSAKDGSVLYTPPARPVKIPIYSTK
jgi:hypothetical protein